MKHPIVKVLNRTPESFETRTQNVKLGDPFDAEESVRNLVLAISEMDDIVTVSSCGGHEDPDDEEGQEPKGNFFVLFYVKPTSKGFRSLGTIITAANNVDRDNITVTVENPTDDPDYIDFTLLGTDGVSPDQLADEIRSQWKIFQHPKHMWKLLIWKKYGNNYGNT